MFIIFEKYIIFNLLLKIHFWSSIICVVSLMIWWTECHTSFLITNTSVTLHFLLFNYLKNSTLLLLLLPRQALILFLRFSSPPFLFAIYTILVLTTGTRHHHPRTSSVVCTSLASSCSCFCTTSEKSLSLT